MVQKKNIAKQANKGKSSKNFLIKIEMWGYILISVISFAVYANSLGNEFVFDDESVVLGDPSITHLYNIPKFFTAQEGFHKVIGRYFRPVVSTSYTIDYAIWKLNPFGFHLTNVIINIINSLLVFKFLLLIFGKYKTKYSQRNENNNTNTPAYLSILGALIFGDCKAWTVLTLLFEGFGICCVFT